MPKLLLLGAGYTGQRFLHSAEARRDFAVTAWRSQDWNLDSQAPLPTAALCDWTHVAYLVPPPATGDTDPRVGHALARLLGRAATLRRFVYVSTTGVYGDAGGTNVDETTPPNPGTPRARRRLDAEQRAVAACENAGVEWVILRVPGIYGPGRLPLERLRRGDPLPESALARPGNRIHVDDLVDALRLALLHTAAANTVFNVGDGDHTGTAAYLQQLAAIVGLPAPAVLPDAEARERISAEAWSFLMEGRRVDTQRIRQRLGFQPLYASCADGLRASLAED